MAKIECYDLGASDRVTRCAHITGIMNTIAVIHRRAQCAGRQLHQLCDFRLRRKPSPQRRRRGSFSVILITGEVFQRPDSLTISYTASFHLALPRTGSGTIMRSDSFVDSGAIFVSLLTFFFTDLLPYLSTSLRIDQLVGFQA